MTDETPAEQRVRTRGKSRRWKWIVLGAFVAAVVGWHFVPAWRQHVLASALDDLKAYRRANGRFPTSQAELDEALDEKALARRGCYVEYRVGANLDSYTVTYHDYNGGKGCTLHFNHDCFCDFPDESRYEVSLEADETLVDWGSWCD